MGCPQATATLLVSFKPQRNTALKNQTANWVKRMYIEVSPSLPYRRWTDLHADRPIVVYEGDTFQPGVDERGNKYVRYSTNIPRGSKTIIRRILQDYAPRPTHDFFWMLPRWHSNGLRDILSGKNSRGNSQGAANALYSSNGGQIVEAKTIKHAFKTFPKIALGQFATLQQSGWASSGRRLWAGWRNTKPNTRTTGFRFIW